MLDPDEYDLTMEYEDEIQCMACGRPVRDGGGLYCSSFCESLGNPDSEGL